MSRARSKYNWTVGAVALAFAVAAAAASASWSSQQHAERVARAMTGGDPERAPEITRRYGCSSCHTIPGIPGADGQVGPRLSGLLHRVYIGGGAVNSPDQLVHFIVTPQQFSPHSAMPASGLSEAEARDVTAYLYAR
jgi:cytochrome c